MLTRLFPAELRVSMPKPVPSDHALVPSGRCAQGAPGPRRPERAVDSSQCPEEWEAGQPPAPHGRLSLGPAQGRGTGPRGDRKQAWNSRNQWPLRTGLQVKIWPQALLARAGLGRRGQ